MSVGKLATTTMYWGVVGSYDNLKCEISKFLKILCPRFSKNSEKIEKEFLLHYFSNNDAFGLFQFVLPHYQFQPSSGGTQSSKLQALTEVGLQT